jgi:hypothetical protein
MPAGGAVDLIRAWRYMDGWQELSLNFLLLVIAVTSLQVVRVLSSLTVQASEGLVPDGVLGKVAP